MQRGTPQTTTHSKRASVRHTRILPNSLNTAKKSSKRYFLRSTHVASTTLHNAPDFTIWTTKRSKHPSREKRKQFPPHPVANTKPEHPADRPRTAPFPTRTSTSSTAPDEQTRLLSNGRKAPCTLHPPGGCSLQGLESAEGNTKTKAAKRLHRLFFITTFSYIAEDPPNIAL
jgi:hypothetical protein